jgi:1,4-alpha-glucan branching enzyme
MSATKNVEFKLFAPYIEGVKLIGNWNDWEPIPMEKDDGGYWQAVVPLAGGEYQYKFKLKSNSSFHSGEWIEVADPYATHFSDNGDGNAVIIIKGGQRIVTSYKWQHDGRPLPANHELVIYELHIGDFRGGPGDEAGKGTFLGVIEKLGYLEDLGINALEFMPIKETPGEHSWGYNPRSFFAVENSYGTPDDFCQMVDECHGRGIRVILDGVYNHMEDEAPLAHIDHDYWFHPENTDPEHLRFGPKLNFFHHDQNLDIWPARKYVLDSILYWIDEFHIDGIRLDATYVIDNYDFLYEVQSTIYDHVGNVKPFYTIAEHVPQDPSVTGPDGPLDAAWRDNLSKQLMCTVLGTPKDDRKPFDVQAVSELLDPRSEGFGGAFNAINYIDNHDQDRIMLQLGEYAQTFDDAAFRRVKLGAGLLLTIPGVPMIWMGQEFGEVSPKSLDPQPLDWILLENEANAGLMRYYCRLIHLRKSLAALHHDSYEVIFQDPERGLLAFKRWDEGGGQVIVVANLKDEYAGEFEISNTGLEDGQWHEFVFDYDTQVQDSVLRDTLAESEVKIYIRS